MRGRAEGIRHLARQANLALQGELEHTDVRHPRLHRYELPWSQWGAPNPDNIYARAAIDPEATYVLRGNVGGTHEALFSLVQGDMHLGENDVYGEVAFRDLEVAGDGAFELVIGPRERQGNHLRTTTGVRMLLIRQYLYDWAIEPIVSFTIERSDTAGDLPPQLSADDLADAIDRAARWVERSIDYWAEYVGASRDLLEHNTFTAPNTPLGGAPSIAYGGGCWDLGPDDALVIEHDVPDAHYWNWSIHQHVVVRLGRVGSAADELQRVAGACRRRRQGAIGRGDGRPRRAQLARHRIPPVGHGGLSVRGCADEATTVGDGRAGRRRSERCCRRRIRSSIPTARREQLAARYQAAQRRWS